MPEGRYVRAGKHRFFVREHPNPGKPTLVLLHGLVASTWLNWRLVFGALKDDFHIIAPDLRGHGRSQPGREAFTITASADDVAGVLKAMQVESAIFAGYSLGGAVAQQIWRRHRHMVDGLVFVATGYMGSVTGQRDYRIVRTAMDSMVHSLRLLERVRRVRRQWRVSRRALGLPAPKRNQRARSERRIAFSELNRNNLRAVCEAAREIMYHDASDWIDEIDAVSVVLATSNDNVFSLEHQLDLADRIGARVFEYESGHLAIQDPAFGNALAAACCNAANRSANNRPALKSFRGFSPTVI